jgi:phage-related protein
MPLTRVVLFRETDGSVPLLEWLAGLRDKPRDKCVLRLRRLHALGYELRRPEADYLRDGIYELRVGLSGVNYRMLYFFHENIAAVVSHGLTKQREVPTAEIELAIKRKAAFLRDPVAHTAEIPDV